MPVLGNSTASSAGVVQPGVYLPAGWNTRWKAARDASAITATEVAIFGDSTTYGACTTTSPNTPIYSWINKLRSLSAGAGFIDGGPGVVYPDTTDNHNFDGIVYQVAKTGFAAISQSFLVSPGAYQSTTAGDTITLQGRGTTARIFYSKQANTGSFSYSIDGGAAVNVNANATGFSGDIITVTGLTDAVHTVTITNLGGGSANAVGVVVAFLRSTGITYNKYAISGNTTSTWFGTTNPTVGNFWTQLPLGLTPGVTGAPANVPFDWGTAKLGAGYPHPSLALCVLGINDMQGLSITNEGNPSSAERQAASDAVAQATNNVLHFVRLCRAADIDPVVVVPHLDIALHGHTYAGQYASALWGVGLSAGCAVVDFNQAVRPIGTMVARGLGSPGVHAEVGTYDAEATFLWQNALAL
jgi:hypothetical protein